MKIIRISDPLQFANTLKSSLSSSGKIITVFFGSEDPQTGESWCPDCVVSDSNIRKNIMKIADSILIECPVGDKKAWKENSQHPYKKEPLYISKIPTVICWNQETQIWRLVEEECNIQEKWDTLLK